jgi:NAD(P)-dependent dehydrogenase (short-subunit alcohol dehydrogenase family)
MYSEPTEPDILFDVRGQTAAITGGSGVLGAAMARGLARAGMGVALLGRREGACEAIASSIRSDGGEAIGVSCDVLDPSSLAAAVDRVTAALGPADVLVNAAGGNRPEATTTAERSFFDLAPQEIAGVIDLNLLGTFLSCQAFGRGMAERGAGCIVNIASMAAMRPLTRVGAYGAAKAAVVNLTQWLAVHMATEYGPGIRVNAIAPGFFLTEQNRYLLTDAATGEMTPRGRAILAHTPVGRLGAPEDLIGTLRWLIGPGAAFVTGIVVPVDGGFSAYAGL